MNKFLKLSIVAFACAGIFAACNKGSGGVKVSSPKDGRNGGAAAKPGAKNDPTPGEAEKVAEEKIKKFPVEKQEALKSVSAMIRDVRPLFVDANKLFNEIWNIILKGDSKGRLKKDGLKGDSLINGDKNIFKTVAQAMEKRFDINGLPPLPEEEQKQLETCKKEGKFLVGKDPKNPNVFKFKFSKDCNDLSSDVMDITKLDSDKGWQFKFAKEVDGIQDKDLMGSFIKGPNISQQEILSTTCTLVANSQGRLSKMQCSDIAQDLTSNGYGIAKTWNFSWDTTEMDCGESGVKKNFCANIEIHFIDDKNEDVKVEVHVVDNPDLNALTTEFVRAKSKEKEFMEKQKAEADEKAKAEKLKKENEQKEAQDKAQKKPAARGSNTPAGILPADQAPKDQDQDPSNPPQQDESVQQVAPEAMT